MREIVRKGLERKIREMKIIGIDPILVARLLEVGSSNPLITFSWGNPPNIFLYDIFRQINNWTFIGKNTKKGVNKILVKLCLNFFHIFYEKMFLTGQNFRHIKFEIKKCWLKNKFWQIFLSRRNFGPKFVLKKFFWLENVGNFFLQKYFW